MESFDHAKLYYTNVESKLENETEQDPIWFILDNQVQHDDTTLHAQQERSRETHNESFNHEPLYDMKVDEPDLQIESEQDPLCSVHDD